MDTHMFATVAIGTLVLAGLAVAVKNGRGTAQVINAGGSAWSNIVKAATVQG